MQKRRLSRSNIEVSALGLGGLAISGPFAFLGDNQMQEIDELLKNQSNE